MSTPTLDVTLQGRPYSIACAAEEREGLLEAVALLDAKMADIAKKTKSSGERLAVMAALNLAHELTSLKKSPAAPLDTADVKRRIQAMEARLEAALAQQEDLF
ncbi:MAG: cell division protein ZapA [Rhodocyclaceae bacterium]|nr:cell division protein ZapA [Rhodocyclaceae bacterium]